MSRNAILGFIFIGLPCLWYTLFGRFSRTTSNESCEFDDVVIYGGEKGLKAYREDYDPPPFYFKQEYVEGFRFVAWTSQVEQLKRVVYDLVCGFSEDLDVLLKICREDNPRKFKRFHGNTTRDILIPIMRRNEAYIFSDGDHQLCVRDLNSDENIALDEHGVLFVYSDSTIVQEVMDRNDFENRNEELIYDAPHFHIRTDESFELGENFAKALNLKRVGFLDELIRVFHYLRRRLKLLISRRR